MDYLVYKGAKGSYVLPSVRLLLYFEVRPPGTYKKLMYFLLFFILFTNKFILVGIVSYSANHAYSHKSPWTQRSAGKGR